MTNKGIWKEDMDKHIQNIQKDLKAINESLDAWKKWSADRNYDHCKSEAALEERVEKLESIVVAASGVLGLLADYIKNTDERVGLLAKWFRLRFRRDEGLRVVCDAKKEK